jgi:hypothetical protein
VTGGGRPRAWMPSWSADWSSRPGRRTATDRRRRPADAPDQTRDRGRAGRRDHRAPRLCHARSGRQGRREPPQRASAKTVLPDAGLAEITVPRGGSPLPDLVRLTLEFRGQTHKIRPKRPPHHRHVPSPHTLAPHVVRPATCDVAVRECGGSGGGSALFGVRRFACSGSGGGTARSCASGRRSQECRARRLGTVDPRTDVHHRVACFTRQGDSAMATNDPRGSLPPRGQAGQDPRRGDLSR